MFKSNVLNVKLHSFKMFKSNVLNVKRCNFKMFKTNGKLGENLLRTLLEFFKKKKKSILNSTLNLKQCKHKVSPNRNEEGEKKKKEFKKSRLQGVSKMKETCFFLKPSQPGRLHQGGRVSRMIVLPSKARLLRKKIFGRCTLVFCN